MGLTDGKEKMNCSAFFLGGGVWNDTSYSSVERGPDSLCADEAGDIGQDGLTAIDKMEKIPAREHPVKGYLKILEGFQMYLLFCQPAVAAWLSWIERQYTEGVQKRSQEMSSASIVV